MDYFKDLSTDYSAPPPRPGLTFDGRRNRTILPSRTGSLVLLHEQPEVLCIAMDPVGGVVSNIFEELPILHSFGLGERKKRMNGNMMGRQGEEPE